MVLPKDNIGERVVVDSYSPMMDSGVVGFMANVGIYSSFVTKVLGVIHGMEVAWSKGSEELFWR